MTALIESPRRRHVHRQIEKHTRIPKEDLTERSPTQVESLTVSSENPLNLQSVIDFFDSTMPKTEINGRPTSLFREGMEYAAKYLEVNKVIDEISESTIRTFLAKAIASYRDDIVFENFDVEEMIRKNKIQDLLVKAVNYNPNTFETDHIEHLSTQFEDPYTKLGSGIVLSLAEIEIGPQITPPTPLEAKKEYYLVKTG